MRARRSRRRSARRKEGRLARVGDQVHEHLHELLAHRADREHLGPVHALDAHLGGRQHVLAEGDRPVDDRVKDDRPQRSARGTRVAHELAGEAQHAVGGVADAPEAIDVLGVSTPHLDRPPDQVVGVGDDRRERVVELVDDPGGDLPERRQLVGVDHPLLERVGRSLGDRERAGHRAGVRERATEHGRRSLDQMDRGRAVGIELVVVGREVQRGAPGAARDRNDVLVREAGGTCGSGLEPGRALGQRPPGSRSRAIGLARGGVALGDEVRAHGVRYGAISPPPRRAAPRRPPARRSDRASSSAATSSCRSSQGDRHDVQQARPRRGEQTSRSS